MSNNLDLNILKVLISNKIKAVSFAREFDASIFSFDSKDYAKWIIDYIKAYGSIPTKRTLLAKYGDDSDDVSRINSFWNLLDAHNYDDKDFEYDVFELKSRFKKNTIKKISNILLDKMQDGEDPNAIIKDININLQKLSVIDDGRSYTQEAVGDYVTRFMDNYDARSTNQVENREVKTGYSMIDSVTGGFAPSELIIIAGETNAGKSMLLSNMSIQMWMQGNDISSNIISPGYNVLYFSLEMPYEDCFRRFLARVSDVPEREIKNAKLSQDDLAKMHKGLDFIKRFQKAGYFYEIVDVPREATIEEIELRYNDALLKFKPDIVVVDYMGLMHDRIHAKDPDWLKLGAIAASLHEFSRAYEVSVLTAVQLTDIKRGQKGKDSASDDQKVGVHRIGRSSLILHHANVSIQIETRSNERLLPDLKYHIIKSRKGPLASGSMIKNFECSSLYDVPYIDSSSQVNSGNIPELIRKIRESNTSSGS